MPPTGLAILPTARPRPAGEFPTVEPSSAPWRVVEADPQGSGDPPEPKPRDLPWVAIGALLIALVVGGSALLLALRPDPGVEVDGALGASGDVAGVDATASDGAVAVEIVVEVGGAVVQPGVYRLPGGSRVMDAVTAAGGFGPRVDAALADRQLNLAATVHDGDEIHVPARGEAQVGGGGGNGGASGGAAGVIDLNTATAESLDTLPGVGPATAAKIIAAREEQRFASVDDLGTRKVLGPATLEKIRALVTVGS